MRWMTIGGIVVGAVACAGQDPIATDGILVPRVHTGITVDTGVPLVLTPDDCFDEDLGSALPAVASGTTVDMANHVGGACGGQQSDDVGHRFTAPAAGRYRVQLTEASFDAVLYVQDGCRGAGLGCADVAEGGLEILSVDLEANQSVLVVVDGRDAFPGTGGSSGTYGLQIDAIPAFEESCSDGVDDDVDGLTDCADQDCDGDLACFESCTDGIDNDGNGGVDCLDAACDDDPYCDPVCPRGQLDVAPDIVGVSTLGLPSLHDPSCAPAFASSDYSYTFTAPTAGLYTFDTAGSDFDTVLMLLSDCGGFEIVCDDDGSFADNTASRVEISLAAGQSVLLVIDGYMGEAGQATLDISVE